MFKSFLIEECKDIKTDIILKTIPITLMENLDIYEGIFLKDNARKPQSYLPTGRSIISVGMPVDMKLEYYQPLTVTEAYKGYGEVFEVTKRLVKYLNRKCYPSKRATLINQKTCAVLSGQGVLGKQGLVLNERYGTRLRFDAVVTEYVPDSYDQPLNIDLCKSCKACTEACPHHCISNTTVKEDILDKEKCNSNYRPKIVLTRKPMCNICQVVCPYNKDYVNSNHVQPITYP